MLIFSHLYLVTLFLFKSQNVIFAILIDYVDKNHTMHLYNIYRTTAYWNTRYNFIENTIISWKYICFKISLTVFCILSKRWDVDSDRINFIMKKRFGSSVFLQIEKARWRTIWLPTENWNKWNAWKCHVKDIYTIVY
jgi:hypothetical protein